LQLALARGLDGGAGEGDFRVLVGLEEVGAAQVLVEGVHVAVHAGQRQGDGHGRGADVVGVIDQGAAGVAEVGDGVGEAQVVPAGDHVGVGRVDLEGNRLGEGGGTGEGQGGGEQGALEHVEGLDAFGGLHGVIPWVPVKSIFCDGNFYFWNYRRILFIRRRKPRRTT